MLRLSLRVSLVAMVSHVASASEFNGLESARTCRLGDTCKWDLVTGDWDGVPYRDACNDGQECGCFFNTSASTSNLTNTPSGLVLELDTRSSCCSYSGSIDFSDYGGLSGSPEVCCQCDLWGSTDEEKASADEAAIDAGYIVPDRFFSTLYNCGLTIINNTISCEDTLTPATELGGIACKTSCAATGYECTSTASGRFSYTRRDDYDKAQCLGTCDHNRCCTSDKSIGTAMLMAMIIVGIAVIVVGTVVIYVCVIGARRRRAVHPPTATTLSRSRFQQVSDVPASVSAPVVAACEIPPKSSDDAVNKIGQLKGLLDCGAITQAEFDDKKSSLLEKI